MPSAFYDSIAADVLAIIAETGRTMRALRMSSVPADANKPWRGPADGSAVASDVAVKAVFDEASIEPSASENRPNLKTQKVYVAASGAPDLSLYHKIVDADARVYRIVSCVPVKPGDVVILYELEVES